MEKAENDNAHDTADGTDQTNKEVETNTDPRDNSKNEKGQSSNHRSRWLKKQRNRRYIATLFWIIAVFSVTFYA